MQRDIAVYSADGELLQWVDEKRFRRLAEYGRVARVVKTRAGRVKRATLHAMPGEARPSLLLKEPSLRLGRRKDRHGASGRPLALAATPERRGARLVVRSSVRPGARTPHPRHAQPQGPGAPEGSDGAVRFGPPVQPVRL